MASTDLQYNLEISISNIDQRLNTLLSKMEKDADAKGKAAGKKYGDSFSQALNAEISVLAFSSVLGTINKLTGVSREYQSSNIGLSSSIKAVANQVNATNSSLTKENATYEEKAALLGITSEKLYITKAASAGMKTASDQLSRSIELQNRAFEDSIKPLEKTSRIKEREIDNNRKEAESIRDKIAALREETQEKIKRVQDGGLNELLNQKKALDTQIKQINVQKKLNEANSTNQLIAQNQNLLLENTLTQLEAQKGVLELQIDTKQDEIDKIKEASQLEEDRYTRQLNNINKVGKLLQDQFDGIRKEIEDKRIEFDINIEPARRKLEDLRSQAQSISGSSGSEKVIDPKYKAFIDKATKERAGRGNVDPVQAQKALEAFKNETRTAGSKSFKFTDFFSQGSINDAYRDFLSFTGGDIQQSLKLLERAAQTTSDARLSNKSDALTNLSFAIRNGLSALANNSGLPENFGGAGGLDDRGTQLLIKDALSKGDKGTADRLKSGVITESELADARIRAVMQVTEDSQGKFTSQVEAGTLEQQKFNLEIEKTQAILGAGLLPVMNSILEALTPFLQGFGQFAQQNPALVVALAGTAFGLSSLLGLLSNGLFLFSTLGKILPATGISFAVLTGPIGLTIAGVAALVGVLVYLYNTNEDVRNKVNQVWTDTVKWVMWAKDNWVEALGQIIGTILTLPAKLGTFAADIAKSIDFGQLLRDNFNKFFEWITSDDTRRRFNDAMKSFTKGLVRGLFGEDMGNNILKGVGLYAKGGYFTKPTLGVFAEAGDEALLNRNAIDKLGLTPRLVEQLNAGGSSINGSYNTTNSSTTNIFGSSFGFNPIPATSLY